MSSKCDHCGDFVEIEGMEMCWACQDAQQDSFNAYIEDEQNKEKLEAIKEFCIQHREYMWAAHIWSIITGKGFQEIAYEKSDK